MQTRFPTLACSVGAAGRAFEVGVPKEEIKLNSQGDKCRNATFFDLRIILAVAETASFRQAALIVDLGQSAVSRRVGKLEDNLGVSLFERSSIGARLTNAGGQFVRESRSILAQFDDMVAKARSNGAAEMGRLCIGFVSSLSNGSIRSLLIEYGKQHPNVELSFVETNRSDLLSQLRHRSVDVVLVHGDLQPETTDSLLLTKERVFVAISSASHLAACESLGWADIEGETFLVSREGAGQTVHDFIARHLTSINTHVRVRQFDVGREALLNLIGLGHGVSFVVESWCGVKYPNVVYVPVNSERVPFSVYWQAGNDNPALRRFVSLARVHAKKAASDGAASQRPDPLP